MIYCGSILLLGKYCRSLGAICRYVGGVFAKQVKSVITKLISDQQLFVCTDHGFSIQRVLAVLSRLKREKEQVSTLGVSPVLLLDEATTHHTISQRSSHFCHPYICLFLVISKGMIQ